MLSLSLASPFYLDLLEWHLLVSREVAGQELTMGLRQTQAAQLRVKKPNDAGRGGVHYTTLVDTAVYSRCARLNYLFTAQQVLSHHCAALCSKGLSGSCCALCVSDANIALASGSL